MTDSHAKPSAASSPGNVEVTMQGLCDVMESFGVTLHTHEVEQPDAPEAMHAQVATANLNGYNMCFALMGGAFLVVRADRQLDIPSQEGDPVPYLACNQANAMEFGAKCCIFDRADNLLLRVERETIVGAGMNDQQLTQALRSSVDYTLLIQQRLEQAMQALRAAD